MLKNQLIELKEKSKTNMIESEQVIKASKSLTQFVTISETYRKRFSEGMRNALS